MKTYQIGIVGYGGFGKFLHHWWNTLATVKVAAASDGRFEDELTGEFRKYNKWEDLIADDDLDIVSIATPPAFHVKIACAAMRSGKHVLLEKPVAITVKEAETLRQVQHETGKVIMVDHMLRYNPIIKALIKLSKEETFGKLRHAIVSNYAQDESLPAEHWFWDKEVSGGIFIEHGVHFFDIINALTDQKFTKVYGASHGRNEQQVDQVSAMVLYNEGLIASHYHSFSGPGFFEETTIRLMYDLAKVEIKGWIPMSGSIKVLANAATREKLNHIPGLKIINAEQISGLVDVSRPEGWGDTSATDNVSIKAGGLDYQADEMISAEFEITQSKSEIYGHCLKSIIYDLITKIENPSHQLNVTLDDAIESLKIAELAEKQ
ncbi:MAG: Gfo/Idh/MocA family oxidoreductase [Pedobacter sp.]|nr:MAG: Gfo/Idh/MocA family oxidoreductase [Pedobacter sp.]